MRAVTSSTMSWEIRQLETHRRSQSDQLFLEVSEGSSPMPQDPKKNTGGNEQTCEFICASFTRQAGPGCRQDFHTGKNCLFKQHCEEGSMCSVNAWSKVQESVWEAENADFVGHIRTPHPPPPSPPPFRKQTSSPTPAGASHVSWSRGHISSGFGIRSSRRRWGLTLSL